MFNRKIQLDSVGLTPKMAICPACGSDAIQYNNGDASKDSPGHWRIAMTCGNCEQRREDVWSDDEIDHFLAWEDEIFTDIKVACANFVRSNMSEYTDRFLLALNTDNLLPEDF